MAWKVIRKLDEEIIKCNGCKNERWLEIVDSSNFSKYICERCGNAHTLYVDRNQFKVQQV